ncbi:carbon starvation CstA family protein, partial [Klebsiella pneumoniae]
LVLAIIGGGHIAADPFWGPAFTLSGTTLAIAMMAYGFIASVIPVWLLLAPRDYLSTFLKIGAIVALAVGILIVRPHVQ